jgi:hypothetical protein
MSKVQNQIGRFSSASRRSSCGYATHSAIEVAIALFLEAEKTPHRRLFANTNAENVVNADAGTTQGFSRTNLETYFDPSTTAWSDFVAVSFTIVTYPRPSATSATTPSPHINFLRESETRAFRNGHSPSQTQSTSRC